MSIRWNCFAAIALFAVAGCCEESQPLPAVATGNSRPVVVNSADSSNQDRRQLEELLILIRQRLELMPGVAQAKWNSKRPITDPKREAALLDDMQSKGDKRGLPPRFVRDFFQAQMTAAKLLQEQHFAEWTTSNHPPFPQAPDLVRDVRPKIDSLNEKLLVALSQCWMGRPEAVELETLDQVGAQTFQSIRWSPEIVNAALLPLRRAGERRSNE